MPRDSEGLSYGYEQAHKLDEQPIEDQPAAGAVEQKRPMSDVIKQMQERVTTEKYQPNTHPLQVRLDKRAVKDFLRGSYPAETLEDESELQRVVDAQLVHERVQQELIDRLTGFEKDRAYEHTTARFYREAIEGHPINLEELRNSESGEQKFLALLSQLQTDSKLVDKWTFRIDIAYLSYWNDPQFSGHQGGDTAISAIATGMKQAAEPNKTARLFRVGGDENAITATLAPDEVGHFQQQIMDNVHSQPTMAGAQAPYRVDVGPAGMSEGALALEELEKSSQGQILGKLLNASSSPESFKQNLSYELGKIADHLADARAVEAKTRTSLMTLVNFYRNDQERFRALHGFMKKGALQITAEELATRLEGRDRTVPDSVIAQEIIEAKQVAVAQTELQAERTLEEQEREVLQRLVKDSGRPLVAA